MPNNDIIKDLVILYVEDEDEVRNFTLNTLSNISKEVIAAENGLIGLEIFTERYNNSNLENFDIVVTDINMPKMNGLDMLKEMNILDSTTPFIITTAHNDSDFLRQAIDLGVRGYVTKPMNLFQLLQSIKVAVEPRILRKQLQNTNKLLEVQVKQRTQELEETIKKLELHTEELLYQATHDHLTKLYNRYQFNTILSSELLRVKRYPHDLSIIMFDIDYFKKTNDTYGHNIGDEVLINLSNLVQKDIRDIDTLARWGGEEFMILLPETSLEYSKKLSEKLRISIENTSLCTIRTCSTTVSFGVTLFNKNDTKDSFLKRVDEALYEAKNSGRNKVISKC